MQAILDYNEGAVNLIDVKGRTVLHYACAEGSADCVRTLLSYQKLVFIEKSTPISITMNVLSGATFTLLTIPEPHLSTGQLQLINLVWYNCY